MRTGGNLFMKICCLGLLWTSTECSKSQSHRNVSELLDNLLKGYDNSVRPDFGGPPTIVEIDIMVRSMGPVSETEMALSLKWKSRIRTGKGLIRDEVFEILLSVDGCVTYSMDCYFRQSWTDARLSYSTASKGTLALSISMLEKIWKPDTTIRNGKQSHLHTITTPNKFVRLYSDGRVLYSSRLTIKASCPMDLSNFPMDTQRCLLKIGSFGYTVRDVLYRWNPNRTVDIAPDMKMSQFDLISTPAGNSTDRMKSGERSVLEVYFHLRRHTGYFLLQVYLPGYLLVIVSWVSFFLSRTHTGDRVTLGITTQFTITLLGLEARADLPKVPYPTALDFFVFLSFGFIFASIIQFAIVHSFTKVGSGEVYFHDDSSLDDEGSDSETPGESLTPIVSMRRSREENPMSIIQFTPPRFKNNVRVEPGIAGSSRANTQETSSQRHYRRQGSGWVLCGKTRPGARTEIEAVNSVSKVDRFARIFFPLSFITINIFYWYSYLYNVTPFV